MNLEKINLSLFGESGGEAAAPSSSADPSAGKADLPAAETDTAKAETAEGNARITEEARNHIEAFASRLFVDWVCGTEEIRAKNPAFDPFIAMKDPSFKALVEKGVGIREAYEKSDMANKYYALSSRKAMEDAAGKLFNAIKSNRRRPTENGTQQGSAAVTKRDVSQLTKEERKDIIRRVQSGEKISFN